MTGRSGAHPETVHLDDVPVGSYTTARAWNGMLFVSGQIPVTPDGVIIERFSQIPEADRKALRTGVLPTDLREERMVAQTWAVYDSIRRILASQSVGFDAVLIQHIFLTELQYFSAMERVRNYFYDGNPPPTTTVGITGLVIPQVLIEVEVIVALA